MKHTNTHITGTYERAEAHGGCSLLDATGDEQITTNKNLPHTLINDKLYDNDI